MTEKELKEKHEAFLKETEERIRLYCRNNDISYAEITAELRRRANDRIFVYALRLKTTGREGRIESMINSLEKYEEGYITHIESGPETITLLFNNKTPAQAVRMMMRYYQIPAQLLTAVFKKPENIPEK
jgi:hypothetical protein